MRRKCPVSISFSYFRPRNRLEKFTLMTSDIPFLTDRLVEAARYALMRRLLPSIRHNIAGSLQPVGMMAAMLERRMQAAAPDLVQLGKSSQALNTLSREAVATSLNLMNWLAPKDNDLVAVNAAIEESLALVTTDLSFRGFSVVNQTSGMQTSLPRGIFRSVFIASLIALTDRAKGAANVVISGGSAGGQTRLKILLEPGGRSEVAGMGTHAQAYRSIGWEDVQALASAEGVALSHEAHCVQVRC